MQKDETFKEKNELYKKSNDYRKKMQNAYQGKNFKEIHENMGTLNILFEQMEQLGNKEGAGGKAKKQKIVYKEDELKNWLKENINMGNSESESGSGSESE